MSPLLLWINPTACDIRDAFKELTQYMGMTLCMVTHDEASDRRCGGSRVQLCREQTQPSCHACSLLRKGLAYAPYASTCLPDAPAAAVGDCLGIVEADLQHEWILNGLHYHGCSGGSVALAPDLWS